MELMSERATAINPDLLTWTRERAGLSLSDVAHYMHKGADDVAAWETGDGLGVGLRRVRGTRPRR
jgi:DNA-binding transcriptional regulator YiaG